MINIVVKLLLYLIKHHDMKMYGGVKVELHVFVAPVVTGSE
jgi:hypothetical protein